MTTTTMAMLAIGLIVLIGLAATTGKGKANKKGTAPIHARQPLTLNEQPTYFRLAEALPDHIVLAQVAFSALLTTRSQATRNTFDRKVCDFVICTKAFQVLAIVELDDSSHKGKEREDAAREALLTRAGYKVLRYKRTPDPVKLLADLGINAPTANTTEPKKTTASSSTT